MYVYCENNPIMMVDFNGGHPQYLYLDDFGAMIFNYIYEKEASKYPEYYEELMNKNPLKDYEINATVQQIGNIVTGIIEDVIYQDYVLDISLSGSYGIFYVKVGYSMIFNIGEGKYADYFHAGGGFTTPSPIPLTLSTSIGIPKNVHSPKDYRGPFVDIGGLAGLGLDYCFWPNGASASSITVGTNVGLYIGFDYYWLISQRGWN